MSRSTRTALAAATLLLAVPLVSACDAPRPTEPRAAPAVRGASGTLTLASEVRLLAAARGIAPLPATPRIRRPLVLLGQALAFDPLLSGTRDISCMTCHVPAFGTSDGKSLSVGQGGVGLGPLREHPQGVFIPRNAPPFFNLGAMRRLFWDGRVSVDAQGHFHTPAGPQLTPAMTRVFEFGPVSALAMFPVSNRFEMRGFAGNELAAVADTDFTGIWAGLMARIGRVPEYRAMFEAAYPGVKFDDMSFAYASNAIGAFIVDQFSFAGAPWDRFLAGDDGALTPRQLEGAKDFLTLKCSVCHNGATLSDGEFHDVAVAQLGPGQGNGPSTRDDFGRMNVTGDAADRYRFRTTPLRNVELTAPYGHDGAIADLRAFVAHYSESDRKLLAYDASQVEPLLRATVVDNVSAVLAQRDTLLNGVVLTDEVVDRLTDYMKALTDDAARDMRRVVPQRVPSGLPVLRPPR
jgi:cytochrome c peroxidase